MRLPATMKFHHTLICVSLAMILLVTGCAGPKQPVMPTQTAAISSTRTPIPPTATASITPSPTRTSTVTVTTTPTRTSTPISTPFDTIAPQDRDEYVHRLNILNEICDLPCWGMIQPGQTKYEDIEPYLRSLTNDEDIQSFLIYDVIGKDQIYVGFQIDRHYVVKISFSADSYDLSEFLVQNGIPEEIWIRQNYGTPYGIPFWYYKLDLFYPSKGILAHFTGESEVPSVDEAKICPLKVYENSPLPPEKDLALWAPNSIREFSETGYGEISSLKSSLEFHQISEVSNIDEEEFYRIFSDHTNQEECFGIDVYMYIRFADTATPTP